MATPDKAIPQELLQNAEILSYSRSRGLFAGVALNGATLRPDEGTNTELYGDQVTNREIVTGTKTRKSAAGTKLPVAMNKRSLRNKWFSGGKIQIGFASPMFLRITEERATMPGAGCLIMDELP